jgi:sugar phosphate isomerase/epimerase
MVQVTMLNAMAARDFGQALDIHKQWDVKLLDLKDGIFDKSFMDLTDTQAAEAAAMIAQRGLEVHCLSSGLFHADVEQGRERFTDGLAGRIGRLIELSRVFRPQVVRLLGATTSRRAEISDAVEDVQRRHPWLIGEYQAAIDRIANAGFMATIENETYGCILGSPGEVCRLFQLINRPGKVMFTWDVQNMWQAGTWPTPAHYQTLRDICHYVHLKGGQCDKPGDALQWRSALEDASFDVPTIVRDVVASGRVPVLCLNPPHGAVKPGYDYANLVQRDLRYLRRLIARAG